MLNHFVIIRWIKKIIPFWLRIVLIKIIITIQDILYIKLHLKHVNYAKAKKMFVLLSTDYSNLGDHAMTYAHIKMLNEKYPDYKIYEVLVNDTMKCLYSIKKACSSEDIITLKGGGNVGVEYFREELIRRKIIRYFPSNKIIMFPQTIYFPNTRFGNREFNKTVDIFNSNKNFYALVRDKISYDKICNKCKNVYLVPDIVFSLGKITTSEKLKRNGALTCLRSDVEGIYTDNDKKMINSILEKYYSKVVNTDTIKSYKINLNERQNELEKIWNEISTAEILITDRLHGMIFAALTETPCIVLNTYNYKLRGQYEWIKQLNYVYCIDLNKENLESCISKIVHSEVKPIDYDSFKSKYEVVYSIIEKK